MGLVLAQSESFDSDLAPSFLTEHRHFQSRPHLNPHAKHPRRPFHWSNLKSLTRHELAAGSSSSQTPSPPPPHHLALYHANLARHRTPRYNDPSTHQFSSRKRDQFIDSDEGIALARAQDVKLPGEARRMPSLEREDAFWDGRTCKPKRKRESYLDSPGSSQERTESQQSQEEVEELYRMGVLYDDEQLRGEGFSLGRLQRERPPAQEAMWNVRYRPAKRRGRAVRRGSEVRFEGLNLALSFARLGEDEALRGWLVGDEGGDQGEEGEDEDEDEGGGIFLMEGVETYAAVATRAREVSTHTEVDESADVVDNTIEERVQRIKKRVAELTGDEYTGRGAEDEDEQAVEKKDTSVASVESVTETVDERVARIKSELGALYQKRVEEKSAAEAVEDNAENTDAAYYHYQDLITRFEKLKRNAVPTVQEAENNNDDNNDDWALLDLILDGSNADTTATAPVDTCDADDTWIMLGSNGS